MRIVSIFIFSFVVSFIGFNTVQAADPAVAEVFDIDGNDNVQALTDGLLGLRYLFGFRGDALVSQAIGSNATRTTARSVETYLNDNIAQFDIDGNGKTEPLTDGLLLLRYLFGFRGDSLINQTLAADATRKTASEVETYIEIGNVIKGQIISLTIKKIEGFSVDKKMSFKFDGVIVFNSQNQQVTELELPAGESNVELYTSSLIDAADLKIMVKADGYVDMGTTVQLVENQKDYQRNIFLIEEKTGKVQDGIFVEVNNTFDGVDSNGIVTEDITMSLEDSSEAPQLKITIPEGTKLMGADGNTVDPSSSVIVHFDPSERNVLDAYPGGLNVMADVSGTMEQVDFKSAAFASIVLKDEAGKKVKNFDKDITVAMQFKIGTTDGDGSVVKVGDIVPIWSYDEDVGTWTFEKDGTVADLNSSDDFYDVVYQTNHLTYFNLDWKTDTCNANLIVQDGGNLLQDNNFKVVLKLKDYNIERSFIYLGDGKINLNRIPDSRNWELEFFDPISGKKIDTVSNTLSICGDRTIDVDLPSTGNVPVTITEVAVNLVCPTGANVPQFNTPQLPLDVFINDENNFLKEYGLAVNEQFDLRTGADGYLRILDLPRTYFGQVLNVNVFASESNQDLVNLALGNNPGPFPVTIGGDKETNIINLELPEEYCNAGGTIETQVEATVSCPAGNIPNTDTQTAPFVGFATAFSNSINNTSLSSVAGILENGSTSLKLLNGSDYNLTMSPADPGISQNILNNSVTVITAGESKSFDFILSDAYCNGEIENYTYTYINNGITTIETPHINNIGTIDLKDYLNPPISTQLRYLDHSKYTVFDPSFEETVTPEINDVTVNGNIITNVEDNEDGSTVFNIQADRIKVENFEEDGNGQVVKNRDTFVGRLYTPGNIFYEASTFGSNEFQSPDNTIFTSEIDLKQTCFIQEKLNNYSYETDLQTYSYSGDILKIKCTTIGKFIFTNSNEPEPTINNINMSDFTYLKKGVGVIAEIEDNCITAGQALPNNTAGCEVNSYSHKFFVESEPAL